MDEDTTTTPDVQADAGAVDAQPAEQNEPVVAADQPVTEPSEPQQDTAEPQTPSASDVDDKLQKYAASQGLELDSPSAIKAATIAMKAQSEATRNYHKASELEKVTSITEDQLPADATPEVRDTTRIRNLELKYEIQGWKMNNQNKLDLEREMVEVLQDPNKKLLVQEGYLSLDDVYAIARAKAPDNSAEVKSQGKREALESLAHKQQAAVPRGNATTQTAPQEKPFAELSLEEMRAKLGSVRR
jgi:hypothetical protein